MHKLINMAVIGRIYTVTVCLLCIWSLTAESKIVDLTHYINDNATMVQPLFTKFKLEIAQKGWKDLPNGGKAW